MINPFHLLILEDRAVDAELILHELRQEQLQFTSKRVWTETDFQAELRSQRPDIILADYSMPGYDGLSALQLAKQECPEVPVILVSGTLGEETIVDCMHKGAADLVLKQHLNRLVPSVRRALREMDLERERQQADRELRDSRLELKAIYDWCPIMMCLMDKELRILRPNHAASQFSGLTEQALKGLTVGELLCCPHRKDDPQGCGFSTQCTDCPLHKALFDTLYTGQTHTGVEMNVALMRGQEIHQIYVIVHTAKIEIMDQTRILLCLEDVTHRKHAEEKLWEAKSLYNSLVENLPQGVFCKDLTGQFTYVNKLFCELLGKSSEEILGKTDYDFYPHALADKYQIDDAHVMQHRETVKIIEENKPLNKPQLVVQIVKAPLFNANHEIIGIQGIITDISNQRELEAKFLRVQRLESIGSLTSGIAHDLNNVLSPILMSASLLQNQIKSCSDEERNKLLGLIDTSTKRAVKIVKQLLSFGRGNENELESLQSRYLLHEIAQMVRETFPRNITIQENVSNELWPIKGNFTQLYQVLLNLCVNARDAMLNGGTLTLSGKNLRIDECFSSMHPEAKPGPYVHIRVADTGIGIPCEIQTKIFESFFTTKEQSKGTGLGLTTALGIVKNHGGILLFQSKVNVGTHFDVYLPAEIAQQLTPSATDSSSTVDKQGNGELILVVDDEPTIRYTVERVLRQNGYEAILAADGIEATAILVKNLGRIHILLTDIMMPNMDGVSLCRIVKKLDPNVRIVAFTGLASARQTELTALKDMGITNILSKPYGSQLLLQTLNLILSSQK